MVQVQENLASANASGIGKLSEAEQQFISMARQTYNQLSPIPCTKCEYCLPCPNGVAIPRNFAIYNEAVMFNNYEQARNEYKHAIPDDAKASVCIACQECEPKCPQHIPISEWMPHVEEALGLGRDFVMHYRRPGSRINRIILIRFIHFRFSQICRYSIPVIIPNRENEKHH